MVHEKLALHIYVSSKKKLGSTGEKKNNTHFSLRDDAISLVLLLDVIVRDCVASRKSVVLPNDTSVIVEPIAFNYVCIHHTVLIKGLD